MVGCDGGVMRDLFGDELDWVCGWRGSGICSEE